MVLMKWIRTDGMELTYRVDAIVWMLWGGPEQMVCRGYDSMVAIALCYRCEHCIYGFYSAGTTVYCLLFIFIAICRMANKKETIDLAG